MKHSVFRTKIVVWPMVMLTLLIGVGPRTQVWATPTGSASAAVQSAWDQRQQAEATVRQFLTDDVVRQKLRHLGLAPAEVEARLGQLSDQQLREVAAQIDQARAGGWHAAVIVVAVLAAIGLLIWFIVDHQHHHQHD